MVSSTYTDLRELRQVLIEAAKAAGLFSKIMENDDALPGADVIDSSLGKVEESTGYALLIGHRYGQQPSCPKRNPRIDRLRSWSTRRPSSVIEQPL